MLENNAQVDQALNIYTEIISNYSDLSQAETALFQSALIWQNIKNNTTRALVHYLRLEYDYPTTQYLYQARKEAAWIVKYSIADYYRAIGYYQRLYEMKATNQQERDQFLYEIADCYIHLKNYSQALIELEYLLLQHPQSKLRPVILYQCGKLSLLENRPEQSRMFWSQVVDEFPATSYAEDAEFSLARLEEENYNNKEALKAYEALQNSSYKNLIKSKIEHLKQRITDKNRVIE